MGARNIAHGNLGLLRSVLPGFLPEFDGSLVCSVIRRAAEDLASTGNELR